MDASPAGRQPSTKKLVDVYEDSDAQHPLGRGHVWYRSGVPVANLTVYGYGREEPLGVVASGNRKGAYCLKPKGD